ncbi:MAG: family 20 glycosylhydrolase [Bacteroidota bacterium]
MKYIILYILLIGLLYSCSNNNNQIINPEDIKIIPKPVILETRAGYFTIDEETKICFDRGDNLAAEVAEYFRDLVYKGTDYSLTVEAVEPGEFPHGCITLSRFAENDTLGDEGYYIQVKRKKIEISANTPAGLFYAVQTLRQLLPPEFESSKAITGVQWKVPCINITDYPRFIWRGMLLDCCRHFMEPDFIYRYIDLLAYHKMNRLHWHLTEDQGWRIEIKKYPKLTGIGAWRYPDDSTKYGGYYTQEQIRDIVEYARKRHVEIIPEIEMPGHSTAALAAYPQFSCTGGPFNVETNWGVFKDIFCAGDDSTFIFLKGILDEVIELFPSEYIHIGGDEAPKYRWERCDKCQKRMKDENLKDEHELQSWFITEIEKYLNSKGKKLIGWDEILEGGLAPSATVQSWRGMDGAIAAATSGHDAIVSPTSHAYFDYDVKTTNLEKVYSFEPVPPGLTYEQEKHILGGECNMWTERAPQETIDSKVFPRIVAMSEVLWSQKSDRNYMEFWKRLQFHYKHLDMLGVKYGFESEPFLFKVSYDEDFNVTLVKGQENIKLHYTTDGSIPTYKDKEFYSSIRINGKGCIKVAAVYNGQNVGEIAERCYVEHKAINQGISYENLYSPNYPAAGDNTLIDGQRGTKDFRDGLWQGFEFKDMNIIIDLNKTMKVGKITTGFLQSVPSWIFMPTQVDFYYSPNGTNWLSLGIVMNDVSTKNTGLITKDFVFEMEPMDIRYIKIIARNLKYCPEWHPGAGGETWIFADEIIVE